MDIPVVIFTSSACEKDMARAYDERANCYVRKPTDFGGYRDVLRQIRKFWGWEALPKTAKALATILFVEDETTIRGMAKLYLETNGYTVIEAADGVQALELWATHQGEIDLVLTDMMMPRGVSGYELVRKLQADRADVPVIFVSGYTSETFGEGTVLDTATNFLQKPYRLKNLGEMVHDCLAHRVAA
jgi:CheY-like chemotaxis protein